MPTECFDQSPVLLDKQRTVEPPHNYCSSRYDPNHTISEARPRHTLFFIVSDVDGFQLALQALGDEFVFARDARVLCDPFQQRRDFCLALACTVGSIAQAVVAEMEPPQMVNG